MIEINLLPKDLQTQKKTFQFNKEFFIIAGGASFFILLTFTLLLAAIVAGNQKAIRNIEKELAKLEDSKKELRDIKTGIHFLQSQMATAKKIGEHPFYWSQKMNQIADSLQPGIWLTKMELQTSQVTGQTGGVVSAQSNFLIRGRVYSRDQEEAAIVGKFISILKADQDWFKDFGDIQLENIQTVTLGSIQSAEFVLSCPLKPLEKK